MLQIENEFDEHTTDAKRAGFVLHRLDFLPLYNKQFRKFVNSYDRL